MAAHRKETKITHYIYHIHIYISLYIIVGMRRLRLRCVTIHTNTTKTQKKLPSTKIVSHTHVTCHDVRATFSYSPMRMI